MMHAGYWPWILLALLGAYHGVNPAMGWLFAVALGLQKQSSAAVWQALAPIAVGHLIAVGVALLVGAILGAILSLIYLKIGVVILLVAFGTVRILGKGHLRWGGMQVGFKDLTIWSFLMASAHGAGLMLLPVLLGMSIPSDSHTSHLHGAAFPDARLQILALLVHTGTYLLVTGTAAWIVYTRLGLSLLRTSWFNLDRIWAIALLATAALTLFVTR
jgi:hypothetical protein